MQKTLGQERRSQKQVLPRSESFAVLLCLVPQMPSISCNYCSPLETVYNKGSQHFHCVCVCVCVCMRMCVLVCVLLSLLHSAIVMLFLEQCLVGKVAM